MCKIFHDWWQNVRKTLQKLSYFRCTAIVGKFREKNWVIAFVEPLSKINLKCKSCSDWPKTARALENVNLNTLHADSVGQRG